MLLDIGGSEEQREKMGFKRHWRTFLRGIRADGLTWVLDWRHLLGTYFDEFLKIVVSLFVLRSPTRDQGLGEIPRKPRKN